MKEVPLVLATLVASAMASSRRGAGCAIDGSGATSMAAASFTGAPLSLGGRSSSDLLLHEHTPESVLAGTVGLDEAQPRIERHVLGHFDIGEKAQAAIAAPHRLLLGKADEGASMPLALLLLQDRDIVEQQRIGLVDQHQRPDERLVRVAQQQPG